jgi:hypothetical protein
MRDAREVTGSPRAASLRYVQPVNFVADLGAPRDDMVEWRGTPSPASPTFKAGVVRGINPSAKPEEQAARVHPGITASERSKKFTQEDRMRKGEKP